MDTVKNSYLKKHSPGMLLEKLDLVLGAKIVTKTIQLYHDEGVDISLENKR